MAQIPEKPLTRIEQYLAFIAGQGAKLPAKAVSRVEKYLAYIAENGVTGGGADNGDNTIVADSTPTGTVIYYAGKTAPDGYLSCDGTVYDISDYPKLAQFFADNYDAANYWGGDGETTFAVPDWQGEFFRAAGTNGHANQGSGAGVGVHQDGTSIPIINIDRRTGELVVHYISSSSEAYSGAEKVDFIGFPRDRVGTVDLSTVYKVSDGIASAYTTRPTNTSLLVCIKT